MFQLEICKEFDAPVAQLFSAWTDVNTIRRWFAPGNMTVPEAQADVREGGVYKIVMQQADGVQHIVTGQYRRILLNNVLEFSWQWQGSPHTTEVKLLFTSISAVKSKLELVHTEFADAETRDKHQSGWHGCLNNLPQVF